MAAMMGALIASAGQQDRELREVIALHGLLSPTGGVLTLDKAAGFLGMDTAELTLRMIDRSIMCIRPTGSVRALVSIPGSVPYSAFP